MNFGEPAPVKNEKSQSICDSLLKKTSSDVVKHLIKERRKFGIKKYGTELMSHNGRDMKKDLLEEILDALVYCEGVIIEEGADYLLSNSSKILEVLVEHLYKRLQEKSVSLKKK